MLRHGGIARPALAAGAALAALWALSGCGGGSEVDDRAEVKRVLVASSMSDDPAACERYLTQRALEQAMKQAGAAALASCEAEAPRELGDPESVDVGEIEVTGGQARGTVAYHGGGNDGQSLELALLEQDGTWKVDRMVRFVHLDRVALMAAMAGLMQQEFKSGAELQLANCFMKVFAEADEAELERLFLRADEAEMLGLAEDCVRRIESRDAV